MLMETTIHMGTPQKVMYFMYRDTRNMYKEHSIIIPTDAQAMLKEEHLVHWLVVSNLGTLGPQKFLG